MNLKLVAIAIVFASLFSFSAAYKWQENSYERIIAQQQADRLTIVKELTDKVLVSERNNNEITNQLNAKSSAQDATILNLRNQLASYRTRGNGLLINAKCGETAAGIANPTSNVGTTTNPTNAGGVCELPAVFASTVIETAAVADELRARASLCKEYAEAINKQRESIINDQ